MKPFVSILVPACNAEKWIGEAIESALAQTWREKEIIIVDDGSKDQTLAVARRFESRGAKIATQLNQGASTARNHALSLCQGEYIQWLDADDFLAPDKIATQVAAITSSASRKTLLSSAWCRFYFRPHRAPFIPNSLWNNLSPVEWMTRKLETNAWMAIESWLVSRELTRAAGPWDASLSMDDDGDYFSRIIRASDGIVFVPEAKSYVRRANPESLSKSFFSPGKLESQFRSMTLQIARLRGLDDSPRTRAACIKYLQFWFIHFYPEREELVARARALAAELGGELKLPALSWKYAPLRHLFGWHFAKRASFTLPKARAWCVRDGKGCFPSRVGSVPRFHDSLVHRSVFEGCIKPRSMNVNYNHATNLHSEGGPRAALPVLFAGHVPKSLLDVGCGTGTWLAAALELGVAEVCGVDGVDIPVSKLGFSKTCFRQQDLTVAWNLGRRFEAALCLEVAEHMDATVSAQLIRTLTIHSDLVFFSAACPNQPGQHHVNCQWPEYWQQLFNSFGYVCSDQLRWKIWNDARIEPWYRQNSFVARRDPLKAGMEARLRRVMHPDLLPYLRESFNLRRIENGELAAGWYLTLPFKAAVSKLGRWLKAFAQPDSRAADR